jgi:hypothetical protein
MTRRRPLLLAVSALLFAGWVGWLGYLALTTSRPEVLARPQFLGAQLDIIAEVTAGDAAAADATVTVKQVLWRAQEVDPVPKVGASIDVANLPRVSAADGWTGPGLYLLALIRDPAIPGGFRIAPVLHSPGLSRGHDRPRIYHATKSVLEQHKSVRGE